MRIQVNVNNEILKKLDEKAKSLGISRSALCAIFISQGLQKK